MEKWQLTFKKQILVGAGLIILSGILSQIFRNGVFHNVAWITYGLLCILNPVWPESWTCADPKKMKEGCYIAGSICIMMGILTHFGI